MIAKLWRRGQNFPQGFDILVGFKERLARLRLEETPVNDALQPFIGVAALACVKVILRCLRDLFEKVLEQQIKIFDHATDIGRVELERFLELAQDTDKIDDKTHALLDALRIDV